MRILTFVQLPFRHKIFYRDYKDAIKYLKDISDMPSGTIYADNRLVPKYDLHIIVPAYNVEQFVGKCLDSIVSQRTRFSYIATIINDGSTDKTLEVIQRYQANPHIEIITQNNKGFSGARNRGLRKLYGTYTMFVDSDDYLCDNAIEDLMSKALEWNADIVEGSVYCFRNKKTTSYMQHKSSFSQNEFNDNDLWGQPWGKVVRSDYFVNLCFPDGYWYEDSIFQYCVYPFCKKIYTLSNYVYAHRQNPSGITQRSKGNIKSIDHYWIMLYLWNFILDKSYIGLEFRQLQKGMLSNMVLGYIRTKDLGMKVVEDGFIVLRNAYLKIYPNVPDIRGKYKLLDEAIRGSDFGNYILLCRRWQYLN